MRFQKRDFRSCTNVTKNKGDETAAGQGSLKLKKNTTKKRKAKLNNSTLGRENNHL